MKYSKNRLNISNEFYPFDIYKSHYSFNRIKISNKWIKLCEMNKKININNNIEY